MQKMKVVFEVSPEKLLQALSNCGKLKKDIDLNFLQKALSDDVRNYVLNDFLAFIEEGVNSDVYIDFLEDEEYEGEED